MAPVYLLFTSEPRFVYSDIAKMQVASIYEVRKFKLMLNKNVAGNIRFPLAMGPVARRTLSNG